MQQSPLTPMKNDRNLENHFELNERTITKVKNKTKKTTFVAVHCSSQSVITYKMQTSRFQKQDLTHHEDSNELLFMTNNIYVRSSKRLRPNLSW